MQNKLACEIKEKNLDVKKTNRKDKETQQTKDPEKDTYTLEYQVFGNEILKSQQKQYSSALDRTQTFFKLKGATLNHKMYLKISSKQHYRGREFKLNIKYQIIAPSN